MPLKDRSGVYVRKAITRKPSWRWIKVGLGYHQRWMFYHCYQWSCTWMRKSSVELQ